ncbi:hypothetical protein C8R44DRAFT_899392 [Mycena epipterygia]|nr:hypothetical protein C8R44DRAFT_899392 [Mycena epipterygia]
MNVRAKISTVPRSKREVEDGSPTRTVATSLRREGVSGCNAVRCDAQKLLTQARHWRPRCSHVQFQPSAPRAAFAWDRASRKPWNTKTTAYWRSGLAMLNKKHGRECHTCTTVMKALSWMSVRVAGDPADSLRRRDGRGSGRRERIYSPDELSQKIIGSNGLSLNAIKVTRFRENKGSNEVTKKATTRNRNASVALLCDVALPDPDSYPQPGAHSVGKHWAPGGPSDVEEKGGPGVDRVVFRSCQ